MELHHCRAEASGRPACVLAPDEGPRRLFGDERVVYAVARRDWLALYRQPRSDPPGPVGFSDAHLVLGQEPHPVSVLLFRHYQAARFADAATTGMIPSRHCPLDQLTLAPVPAIMTATTAGSSRRGKFPLAAMPVPDRLSRGAAARDVWIRLRRPS